jgi:hypothetical protein
MFSHRVDFAHQVHRALLAFLTEQGGCQQPTVLPATWLPASPVPATAADKLTRGGLHRPGMAETHVAGDAGSGRHSRRDDDPAGLWAKDLVILLLESLNQLVIREDQRSDAGWSCLQDDFGLYSESILPSAWGLCRRGKRLSSCYLGFNRADVSHEPGCAINADLILGAFSSGEFIACYHQTYNNTASRDSFRRSYSNN